MRISAEQRFWQKVALPDENGCWLWTASKCRDGYGFFSMRVNGKHKNVGAHRFSYETTRGKIPPGMTIDHLCRVTSCVNPRHLEVVTQRDNGLRGNSESAKNAKKTHCPKGHEYAGSNLVYEMNRGRRIRKCRECLYEQRMRYQANKRRRGENT